MATIIEFPQGETSSARAATHSGRVQSAEIVLFPGIRYERWESEQQVKPKRKKAVKRDRLELQD